MANVCQHHKYGFCKFLDKCKYKHVKENCNDKSCEINDCVKRHPMLCRYFKEFARCKFGFGWQYDLSKKLNHFYKRIGWMT